MHNVERLTRGRPRHHLLMHPDDLAERGIADGSQVRVASRVGAVEVEVAATDDVMRGVVSLPHGYGHQVPGTRMAGAADGGRRLDQRPHRPRAARRVGQRRAQRRAGDGPAGLVIPGPDGGPAGTDPAEAAVVRGARQTRTPSSTARTSAAEVAERSRSTCAASVNTSAIRDSSARWSSPAPAMPTTNSAGLPFQSMPSA